MIAAASACNHAGSSKLEGRWKGVRVEGATSEQKSAADAFALGTQLVAKGNAISLTVPGKSEQSKYVADSEKDGTIVLHTEADGAAKNETIDVSEDGSTLTWHIDETYSLVFAKLQD